MRCRVLCRSQRTSFPFSTLSCLFRALLLIKTRPCSKTKKPTVHFSQAPGKDSAGAEKQSHAFTMQMKVAKTRKWCFLSSRNDACWAAISAKWFLLTLKPVVASHFYFTWSLGEKNLILAEKTWKYRWRIQKEQTARILTLKQSERGMHQHHFVQSSISTCGFLFIFLFACVFVCVLQIQNWSENE